MLGASVPFFSSRLQAVWPLWKKAEVCLLAWFTVHGDLHSFSMILCFSPLHLLRLNSKSSWDCSNDTCISIKFKIFFLKRGKRNIPKLYWTIYFGNLLWHIMRCRVQLDISPECSLQGNLELKANFLWKTPNYLQLIKKYFMILACYTTLTGHFASNWNVLNDH